MSDNSSSSLSTPLVFDTILPIEVPVEIGGKHYLLREASEAAACIWRNAQLKATRMVDGKVTSMEGLADSEPLLVSLCLFPVTDKEGGQEVAKAPVALSTVKGWTSRVVKQLFERAKAISGLEEKETKTALRKRLYDTVQKLVALGASVIVTYDGAPLGERDEEDNPVSTSHQEMNGGGEESDSDPTLDSPESTPASSR